MNPQQKKVCRIRLQYAVKRGAITKPINCEHCGIECSCLDGHHEDYTKPLKVIWLCTACHGKVHSGSVFTPYSETNPIPKSSEYLTINDVALQLNLTAARVRALAKNRGVGTKHGRDWSFKPEDLDKLRPWKVGRPKKA